MGPTHRLDRTSQRGRRSGHVYRNVSAFVGKWSTTRYTVVDDHLASHRLVLDGDAGPMTLHDTVELEWDGELFHGHCTLKFPHTACSRPFDPFLRLGLKKVANDTARRPDECLQRL